MQSVEVHLPPGMSGDLSNVEQCPEPQANLGRLRPEQPDRRNDRRGRRRRRSLHGLRRQVLPDRPLQRHGPLYARPDLPAARRSASRSSSPPRPARSTSRTPAQSPRLRLRARARQDRNQPRQRPRSRSRRNPPGTPDSIPTSIEGIPLEIQHINAITTRGNFQFNPTNCNKLEATGTIHSTEGATDTSACRSRSRTAPR